ncbi:hypothetical protein [uncultured Paracoccus sp.]|uniref:hypothetical protein n=1 Tax=uncultured Paracoccus sp. TaxID=189685 RepID=UPI00262C5BC9|nr:hypothetical protein [uncultured Paracoccus sp.]
MTTNELATAIANATETEKATLAQFVTEAMMQGERGDADATKRLVVGAMDRFAAEHGAA